MKTCNQCGGPLVRRAKGTVCRACSIARFRQEQVCPACTGPKQARGRVCRACWLGAQTAYSDSFLAAFSPERFAAVLEWSGWSVAALAVASGVSVRAINRWRAGQGKPRRREFELVARALALEPCRGCGGSGWNDPTDKRVQRMVEAACGPIAREAPRVRVLAPVAVEEPRPQVGRLEIDLATCTVGLDGQSVLLTRREQELLAVLAAQRGAWLATPALSELLWPGGASRNGPRVLIARLREKLIAIGAGDYLQSQIMLGYRLVDPEAAGGRRSA